MHASTLYDILDSVTAIPIVPFSGGAIDIDGHRKNIRYLMENNYLDGNRKRVIGIAGTSLIHHFSFEDQMRVIETAGEEMGGDGFLMSGIVPNPIAQAEELVRGQSALPRPPDVYLIMPLTGVADHEATYEDYMAFAERLGESCGARFLLYMRSTDYVNPIIRLVKDSPYMAGVKVGTSEAEVAPLIEGIGDDGIVMWGIGDRSTRAAELGARGHTSGIAVVAARAADEINNAQRRGDYEASARVEACISGLEDLRFMNGRQYNYSAVIEAMIIGEWEDVSAGEGGPFNPRVPKDIAARVADEVESLRDYH